MTNRDRAKRLYLLVLLAHSLRAIALLLLVGVVLAIGCNIEVK